MIFTLAALGLPGTSGFVGEFLILVGVFQSNFIVASIASLGIVFAAAYMLWLYKRVIFGRLINSEIKDLRDLNKVEFYIFLILAILILIIGFFPDVILSTIHVSIDNLIENYQTDINFISTKVNN